MVDENLLRVVMASVFNVDAASIRPDSTMDNIEKWDSLNHMNLVLALEDAFGVTIPDEDAANITSYPLVKIVLEEQLGGE